MPCLELQWARWIWLVVCIVQVDGSLDGEEVGKCLMSGILHVEFTWTIHNFYSTFDFWLLTWYSSERPVLVSSWPMLSDTILRAGRVVPIVYCQSKIYEVKLSKQPGWLSQSEDTYDVTPSWNPHQSAGLLVMHIICNIPSPSLPTTNTKNVKADLQLIQCSRSLEMYHHKIYK